jgi:hypothetical protein
MCFPAGLRRGESWRETSSCFRGRAGIRRGCANDYGYLPKGVHQLCFTASPSNILIELDRQRGAYSPQQDGAIVCGANCSEQSIANGVNEHCRLYRLKNDKYAIACVT